jgi:hypothetical protein
MKVMLMGFNRHISKSLIIRVIVKNRLLYTTSVLHMTKGVFVFGALRYGYEESGDNRITKNAACLFFS